jgi:uncharacterized protein
MSSARLLALTGLSLLLAACGQQAVTTPLQAGPNQTGPAQTAPVQTAPGQTAPVAPSSGVYELKFQGVGSEALKVSAALSRSTLGAQALINAPQGFSFSLLSASTFTNPGTSASGGTRHVRVTYQVTNITGSTLTNLSFVPVNTDEDAAGPANNAGSVPTVGATSFKDVSYFDGSDASSKAASLNAARGQVFNAASGAADTDPNASAFQTGLDVSNLSAAPPTGLIVAEIKNYGWQVAPSLAAGASANVTFAVDLPLDPAGPARDPFNFTLVFTAAQDGAASTAIHSVQGATPAGDAPSPLLGQTVTTSGVVTAAFQGAGQLGGFFLQAPDAQADRDLATSEGLFVFCGTTAPNCPALSVGDAVSVKGAVQEFNKATQLTVAAATDVQVTARAQPLPSPAALNFPLSTRDVLERSEGMRVTVPTTLSVTNNFTLGRFGQLGLSSGGRIFNPTNGQGGDAASNALRLLNIDDGVSSQNPATTPFLTGSDPLTATRRTGDTVTGLSGVLNWFSPGNDYFLYPTTPPAFQASNPRPAAPSPVGGSLKVAGANVLNYFTDLVTSNAGCESTNGLDTANSRGANTCAEFARQQTKIVQVLKGLDADVMTLMEVQNNGDAALNNLRDALNAAYGSPVYAAVQSGKLGTDQIHVAMLYKPLSVTPVGPFLTENPQDAGGAPIYSRPPLAQTFSQNGTGETFSVVANHFKSKGSCPPAGTDSANQDSGQGCWNAKRVTQAQALLNFVQTVRAASGDPDVLLLGDLNAYGDEDPINTLVSGNFESLNKRIPAPDRYSYQFNGNFGYLDHALASSSMSAQVTGVTEWHVNADEPVSLDYNTEFKKTPACTAATCTGPDLNNVAGSPTPFRASDHDPVLVGLKLSSVATPTPALSLGASPSSLSLVQGASGSATISVAAANSSQPVALSAAVSGSGTLPSISLAPSSVGGGAPSTSTATLSVGSGVPVGSYTVTVTGTGEAGSSTTTFTINVTAPQVAGTPKLVISQVYGGGGNAGATLKNDFVELFNAGQSDISTGGLSVQYASATGTFSSGSTLALPSATINPGKYFLVQLAAGTGGTANLPTPDATGSLALSGTGGKIALSSTVAPISGVSDAGLLDFVGWGAANASEGAAAPATSNSTAVLRSGNGCQDSNVNSADFTAFSPAPRNSSSAANICP